MNNLLNAWLITILLILLTLDRHQMTYVLMILTSLIDMVMVVGGTQETQVHVEPMTSMAPNAVKLNAPQAILADSMLLETAAPLAIN